MSDLSFPAGASGAVGHMSYRINSLTGVIYGTIIGVIKGRLYTYRYYVGTIMGAVGESMKHRKSWKDT